MALATNVIQATITSTDANGVTSINRGLGNPTLAGSSALLQINANFSAGTTQIAAGLFFNVYIKNNSAIGSGITVAPVITPNGGAAQTLAPLPPGGVFVQWAVATTSNTWAYSSVSVLVAGGTAPIEFFVGG